MTDVGPWVWLDGDLVPLDEAVIPVTDHAVVVGDGAFETIPVFGGEPFAVSRHLARLHRTIAGLRLPDVLVDDALRAGIAAVVSANSDRAARVRMTVTGGESPLGSERIGSALRQIIGSTAAIRRSPTTPVVTVPWVRNELGPLVGLKTTSYADNVVALDYARERGASEVLFGNTRGELCEGTGSNVFVVLGGQLLTPPLSAGCLAGITRALIIDLTDAVERPILMDELPEVTEAFLTSSTRDVQPISHLDSRPLIVGELTARVQAAYERLVSTTRDP